MADDAAPWRDAETLRRCYYDEALTQAEVGERLGCSRETVRKWLRRHNLSPGRGVPRSGPVRTLLATDPDAVGLADVHGERAP